MVQKLIFWNIGFFLFSLVFFYSFSVGQFQIPTWIALSSDIGTFIRTPWTLITFNFFHSGFLHLFFNLMVLHFSGRLFSTYFTDKQLLGVYVLGGVFSGITFVLSYIFIGKIRFVGWSKRCNYGYFNRDCYLCAFYVASYSINWDCKTLACSFCDFIG